MCKTTTTTHTPSYRLLSAFLSTMLLVGCAAPSNRTQTYSGSRRPAAETASILNQKNREGWSGILYSVDGMKVRDGADVLSGTRTLVAHSGNFGLDMKEVADSERKLIASGRPATVPQSPLQIKIDEPGKTPITLGIGDPRILEVAHRREAATRRTFQFTVQAGHSYIVRCDGATGANLRVEPAGQ